MQVQKCANMQVCKYASVQVCKVACVQVCMCASMQGCKYASMQDFLLITVFATLESNFGFQQCLKSCKASACKLGHEVALLLRCDDPATHPPPNHFSYSHTLEHLYFLDNVRSVSGGYLEASVRCLGISWTKIFFWTIDFWTNIFLDQKFFSD